VKKNTSVILIVIVVLVLVVVAFSQILRPGNTEAQTNPNEVKPTFVPAKDLTLAPTPPDNRQVAILTLAIQSDDSGKVREFQLEKGQIITSYAPNVLNRPGDWTVEVIGSNDKLRYGIQDPRKLDVFGPVENKGGENPAHSSEFATNITYDLIVPLYALDKDLGATEINIYDQDNNRIFSTPVDRERWKGQ
jgi:hypothetical protein